MKKKSITIQVQMSGAWMSGLFRNSHILDQFFYFLDLYFVWESQCSEAWEEIWDLSLCDMEMIRHVSRLTGHHHLLSWSPLCSPFSLTTHLFPTPTTSLIHSVICQGQFHLILHTSLFFSPQSQQVVIRVTTTSLAAPPQRCQTRYH